MKSVYNMMFGLLPVIAVVGWKSRLVDLGVSRMTGG